MMTPIRSTSLPLRVPTSCFLRSFKRRKMVKTHSVVSLCFGLAGGEQQMVAVGRGMMACPELLMPDGPSLGLAPLMVPEVFKVVERFNFEGVTVLLVENVKHTLTVASRAYVLETGRITMEGKGKDLLDNDHVKKVYLGI